MATRRLVGVNERGYRLGQDHQHAKLTDAEAELIRELHEDGLPYYALAEKFGVSKSAIGKICRYERRVQSAVSWKTVEPKKALYGEKNAIYP